MLAVGRREVVIECGLADFWWGWAAELRVMMIDANKISCARSEVLLLCDR